ncbi:CRISPR system precrRNA processing endoribonuclease RAMP protein Cas6 [Acidianus infernus]|uniref:CRISPR system precrRNA processing endoribonuclease RAMP protein Cas6 n=1 Tax=Acidianus infernus TaxID=12915 RepID=A0A6A9QRV8_ACIIN|nr:CRISPR system precrRNA processing endoribonuclease RAMP protein Cas6 [Acidianus infernus]MUM65957.1 CRISPR system precrRNA processing endoribonuclease RAMP protein Cas6 [Acidianus infernus]
MFSSYTLTVKMKYERNGDNKFNNFTGKISKIVVLTELPELEVLFRPTKGFFKPIHVSPPINKEAVYPYYERGVLKEVPLDGEYKIRVGLPNELSKGFEEKVKGDLGVRTRIKVEGGLLEFVIERIEKDTFNFGNRVKLCFSPTLLANPFITNRDYRKFFPSPSAVFWIPYALMKNKNNLTPQELAEIESRITESWKTRIKTIWIPYDNGKEPVMIGKVEYRLLKNDDETRKLVETALIIGVGSSRASGFGHVELC